MSQDARITCRDGFNRQQRIGLWTAPTSDRLDDLATAVERRHAELGRAVTGVGR
ncbi:hypothetical protein [Actinokineospora sp. HUAS TT18]|uniref:hypothetical protein n=1 Tax=Actinokineospora sp. HUAS TT18 TaxID=3447451 RepID=UPI003F51DC04